MNEMKPIVKRYTAVKRFTFWIVSVKLWNFRVPVYKGFPSHEWNDTHPLTMTAGQVYECEKFHFLKSESKSIQLQGSRL